jgi:ClpP class serine protease
MLACAGDEIYANASSIVGSIGVIYSGFGFQDLIKKAGVERRVHTAGKSKSILDPFVEEKPEDIKKLKDIQEDLHKEFINLVKHSRKEKLKSNDDVLFNGEFWAGGKAKELGLIDGIGNVFQVLEDRFGKDVKIKNFEKQEGWLKKKLSSSMADAASSVLTELETRSFWNRFGL